MIIPTRKTRNITIIGAICSFLPNLFESSIVPTTTKPEFIRFLTQVREASLQPRIKPIFMVLDNHKAHVNEDVAQAMQLLNIVPLWMPTYSPEFNSIESLWAVIKRKVQQELAASV